MSRNRKITYAEFRRRKAKRERDRAFFRDLNKVTATFRIDDGGVVGYAAHIAAHYGYTLAPALPVERAAGTEK